MRGDLDTAPATALQAVELLERLQSLVGAVARRPTTSANSLLKFVAVIFRAMGRAPHEALAAAPEWFNLWRSGDDMTVEEIRRVLHSRAVTEAAIALWPFAAELKLNTVDLLLECSFALDEGQS